MSTLLEQLRGVHGREWAVGTVIFLALLAPGALAIWMYAPRVIFETSILHLLFLSTCLTVPFCMLTMVASHSDKVDVTFDKHFIYSAIATSMPMLMVLLAALTFALSWRTVVWIVFIGQLIAAQLLRLIIRFDSRGAV